jgi:hypothetical protein
VTWEGMAAPVGGGGGRSPHHAHHFDSIWMVCQFFPLCHRQSLVAHSELPPRSPHLPVGRARSVVVVWGWGWGCGTGRGDS